LIVETSQSYKIDGQDHRALRHVMSLLSQTGVMHKAAPSLDASMQSAGKTLREAVLAEVPAFSTSGNPEILPTLAHHGQEHIEEIRRLLDGGELGDFSFVKAHAQQRAGQRFPLEAVLHAYRCGHRTLSHWLRDAAVSARPPSIEDAVSAVADFAIEYTNAISTIMAAEYVSHTRLLAEAEGDRRTELLNILLSGYDESDARATRLLKRAGYLEQRQSYCVVVAQAINPAEMELPERAQRIVDAISDAVATTPIRMLVGVRNYVVTAVLSDVRRQSGWTAPQTKLAERLQHLLLSLGPAVLVGLSTDQPSTSFLPRALHEAAIALDYASVARRVVPFAGLPIRSLMLHSGGEYVRSVAPGWAAAIMAADAASKGALIATLRTLADTDLNVQAAGRQLGVHPNTVYARIVRIRDITGLDGQRHHDLVELLLAADCWQT
jgi:NAD(P)-dependent dehydrogenase (short-subunit alcohol dehydrogenase family)